MADPVTTPTYDQKMADFQQDYNNLIGKSGHLTPTPVADQPSPTPSPTDFLSNVQKSNDNMEKWSQDPSFYGKPFSAPVQDYQRFSQSSEFQKLGYDPYSDNENLYHLNQPTLSRLANAGSQLIGKTIGYTVQTAGFLLGAPMALVSNDMSKMTDNLFIKASDVIKDYVQDHNPIYKGDQYTKGSIWDKLSSTDWWMDDAVDRIALTAAMFIPGFAEAKGLGLAAGGVSALKAIAANPESYGSIAKIFLPKLYQATTEGVGASTLLQNYAKTLTTAELYGWNVIGQSALNAKETMEGIRKTLQDQRTKGENTLSDQEINTKAANGAKAAFWETTPITMAEALWTVPLMYSGLKGIKPIIKSLTEASLEEGIPKAVGKIALTAGLTGFEHGQNESMQVAISRYNEDRQAGKDVRGTIPGIIGDYLDNVNDPNGQNNIALGTIQGILMTLGGKGVSYVTGKYNEGEVKDTRTIDLINSAKLFKRLYDGDLSLRDQDGVIIDRSGNPLKDQDKIVDGALSLMGTVKDINIKKAALEQGDYLLASKKDHDNLAGFVYPFFTSPDGLEHAKGILSKAKDLAANDPEFKAWDNEGNPLTPEQVYQNHLNTIRDLKKTYDLIDQSHADFGDLKLDPKDPIQLSRALPFLESHKLAQYKTAADQLWLNHQVERNKASITSLGLKLNQGLNIDSRGNPIYEPIKNPSSLEEQQYNKHLEQKDPLNDALNDSKTNYKKLTSQSEVRKAFRDHVDLVKRIQEQVEKAKEPVLSPPVTETAPTIPQAVTPTQIKPNEAIEQSKKNELDPVLKQRLQEALIKEDQARNQDNEPGYHTLENFIEKSPVARDIISDFNQPAQASTTQGTAQPEKAPIPVEYTPDARTQSFGRWEGLKEENYEDDIVDIIKHPEKRDIVPGYTSEKANDGNGESLNHFAQRNMDLINHVFETQPNYTAIVTSSSFIKMSKAGEEGGFDFNKIDWKKFEDFHTKNGEVYPLEKNGKIIFLVRHGETVDNQKKNLRTPETPLTDKGKRDITMAYNWFTHPDMRKGKWKELGVIIPPKIISSDFLRHRQTTEGLVRLFQSSPAIGILPEFKGKIVFMSAGLGKSEMAARYPDQIVDGDQLLYNFLKEKNIPTTEPQKSGLDFYKYLAKHPKERLDLTGEFQNKAIDAVRDGKTLLTASKYLRAISSPIYLSQDVNRLSKVFEERGETPEQAAKSAAKHIRENREEFQGVSSYDISPETFAQHILTGTTPETEVKPVPQTIQQRAEKVKSLADLKDFEAELFNEVSNGDLDYQAAEQALLNRRREIVKEETNPTFERAEVGDKLIMTDKRYGKFKTIVAKGDDYITIGNLTGRGSTFNVYAKDIPSAIDMIIREGITDEDITPDITPADEAVAINNAKDLKSDDLIQARKDIGEPDPSQAEDDLLNSKDCI